VTDEIRIAYTDDPGLRPHRQVWTDRQAFTGFVTYLRERNAADAQTRAELATTGNAAPHPNGRRPAGDPVALRGIPVVGVPGGIGGASPGTKPGSRWRPM
jgi:hypothetical protein